jgi:hypothetical protein
MDDSVPALSAEWVGVQKLSMEDSMEVGEVVQSGPENCNPFVMAYLRTLET